jgi:hypothetical protein
MARVFIFMIIIQIALFSGAENSPCFTGSLVKRSATIIDDILKAAKVGKKEIKHLSKMPKLQDITKSISKYPDETRKAILLAIANKRGALNASESAELYQNIGKVDGFENVTKLLCAANKPNVQGALFELRTANAAYKKGFKVLKMRNEFYGSNNKLLSDVDVLLKSNSGKKIAIECKDHASRVPSDMIATKADKLQLFAKQNPGTMVLFSFTNEPGLLVRKILKNKGITVLVGKPDAQMSALKLIV